MVAWKFLLASAAFASDQCEDPTTLSHNQCEDQTALLQSHLASHKSTLGSAQEALLNFPKLATLNDPTKRKVALAQFEETALALATNKAGVTDVVVEVCNETAALLEETVLMAIIEEHDVDQILLNESYAAFGLIEADRVVAANMILNSTASIQGRIETHTECRTEENARCLVAGHCEAECTRLTDLEELEAVELHSKITQIKTHVCTIGTDDEGYPELDLETTLTYEQHHTNKVQFEEYNKILANLTAIQEEMDRQCALCQAAESNHTESRTECNRIQQQLENAACNDVHVGVGEFELYMARFQDARTRYENVEASAMIKEADRKVEWDTVTRVICLLMTLTNPEDGAASSTETTDAIAACQPFDPATNLGSLVNTSHLDLQYHELPEPEGFPDLPVAPCSDEFNDFAYEDMPTCFPYSDQYDHGVVIECTCLAQDPVIPVSGFPNELGPFLLFETGFSFDAAGFQLTNNGQEWSAIFDEVSYTGRLSMFAPVTLPALDEAFGVSVSQVAWVYPDAQATEEMNGEAETMQHRFIRTGGFVYLNAGGVPVALKQISPSSSSLGQDAQLTLTFGDPQPITEMQALAACPQLNPITLPSLRDAGAEEYCWNFDATLEFCGHGCFLYKTTSGYIGFPVIDTPETFMANTDGDTYAATDQQGALQASMLTHQTSQR